MVFVCYENKLKRDMNDVPLMFIIRKDLDSNNRKFLVY